MRGPIERFRTHLATFIVGTCLSIGIVLVFLQMGGAMLRGDTYRVKAMLPTTASLGVGSRVTMAGAHVGRVAEVYRQGFATVVELDFTDERVVPIPADSRVTLRQRTPVGENYIAITPGKSQRMLPEDGVLAIEQSDEYVDVDQLLSVLQGSTRQKARQLIQGFGTALDGRGENLNATLGSASEIVDHAASVLTLLDDNRAQTARVVDRLGRVMASVGERGEAVRVTADRGLAAMSALASRDERLRETLDELPATLRQVKDTSATLKATSQTAAPVVAKLAAATRELRPAVQDLAPAARTGRAVVAELGRAVGPLQTTLDHVERASKPVSSALPQLHKTICQVAPVVRYARPYMEDIVAAVLGLGSASNSYDAVGHLIRLTPILGENSLAGMPDDVTKAAHTLTRIGLLGKSSGLTWDPYPEPDMIGKGRAGDKAIFNRNALRESGYKYPRIHSDC